MATTFQAEVTALTNVTIGAAGAPIDGQIDSWCTEGAKDIITRIKKVAPETIPLYAATSTLTDVVVPTNTGVVVTQAGQLLIFSQAAHGYKEGDWVRLYNGDAGSGMDELNGLIAQVNFGSTGFFRLWGIGDWPSFASPGSVDIGPPDDPQLTNIQFPSGIILDVSRSLLQNAVIDRKACEKINDREYWNSNEVDSLSYRSKFNPAYYFDGSRIHFSPLLNQTNNELGYVRAVSYPAIDSDTDTIGDVLNFDPAKQHLISIYGSIKTLEFMIARVDPTSGLDSFDPQLASPSAPTGPSYSFTEAELGGVPDSFVNKGLLPIQALTIPQYNGGNSIGLSTALQTFDNFHSSGFTLSELAEDIVNIAEVEMPLPVGSIVAPTITSTTVTASSDMVTRLGAITPPDYIKPSASGLIPPWTFNTTPDFSHIVLPVNSLVTEDIHLDLSALTIPTPWNEQSDTEVDPNVSTAGFEETVGVSWEAVNEALDNEDFEEASAHLNKISTRVSNQQQMFSQAIQEYDKEFEKVVKVSDYGKKEKWAMELAHWNSKVDHYKMQVQDVFSKYNHDLTRETSKWTNAATQNIALFTAEMTDNLNVFNKESAKYEKEVEAAITDIKHAIDIDVKNTEIAKEAKEVNSLNQYKVSVDQYSQDIAAYNASIAKYAGDVQYYVERYNAHFAAYSDTWKNRQANILDENKTAATEALNIYNADNVKYQADVQMIIAEFNSEAEASIKKMEVATDLSTQNKAKVLEGDIQKYNAIMDRYVGEIQGFQHEIGYEISTYAQAIAKEQQDQAALQLGYTWYQDKYSRLVSEYEAGFAGGAPAPPQGPPQGA